MADISRSISAITYSKVPPICKFRRVHFADVEEIKTLVTPHSVEFFGDRCLDSVVQNCFFSLLALNANGSIVGVICLDDHPNIPSLLPSVWEGWARKLYGLELNTQNSLWFHFIAHDQRYSFSFFQPMLQRIFLEFPMLINLLLLSPGATPILEFIGDEFTCILPIGYSEPGNVQTLFLTLRHQHIKKYKIRLAVEEDNDDIVPLIDAHSKRLQEFYGEFYVSEILTKYPYMKRKIIVAEHGAKAVAVLFLNDDVNYDTLNKSFALEPFCNLHKLDNVDLHDNLLVYDYTASIDNSMFRISFSSVSLGFGDHTAPNYKLACVNDPTDLSYQSSMDIVSSDIFGLDLSLDEFSDLDLEGHIDDAIVVLLSPSATLTEKAPRGSFPNKEFLEYKSKTLKLNVPPDAVPNAFTLEVMAAGIEDEEAVLSDLLEACFQSFPDKEYCVLSVSSNRPHFPLYNYFIKVVPRRFSKYPQELYILHRNAIKANLSVRKIKMCDLCRIEQLLISLEESSIIMENINESVTSDSTELKAFAFFNDTVMIGVAVLRVLWDLTQLNMHFQVHRFVDIQHYRFDRYGMIEHCTFSPIFKKHAHYLLRELHRLSDMAILFHKLHVHETISNMQTVPLSGVLKVMLPVPKSFRPEYSRMELPTLQEDGEPMPQRHNKHALFISTVRLCSLPRVQINNLLVVVGASNVGLSFLEHLIFQYDDEKFVIYNNLTLVHDYTMRDRLDMSGLTPSMFVYHGRYEMDHFNAVCFRCHVNYVYGFMVAINRKEKFITLDNDTVLSYDYLFLTGGQQYHQPYSEGLVKEVQPRPSNVFVINGFRDTDEAFRRMRTIIQRTNKYTILVYGASLHAYCCIATLQKMNIPNSSIVFVEPFPKEGERPVINVFNNVKIYDAIHDLMTRTGIRSYISYYFHEWELHKRDNTVKKVSFTSRQGLASVVCDLVFFYDNYEVNYKTFTALNSAGLVYDGKLVISSDCRTNDEFIYAAGPLTKYSRRYFADKYLHKYYSSMEIGERLARQMRASLLPGGLQENEGDPVYGVGKEDKLTVPQYKHPVINNCHLPGGLYYLDIRSPGKQVPMERTMFEPNYGWVLETGDLTTPLEEDPKYFRIHVDAHSIVRQITCYTKQQIDVHNMMKLWGKPEKMLNNLHIRFKLDFIPDFFEYFRQPYFYAIYLDTFADLWQDLDTTLQLLTEIPGESLIEDIVAKYCENDWKKLTDEQESEIVARFDKSGYQKLMINKIMDFIGKHSTHLLIYGHPVITKLLMQKLEQD